MSVFLRVFVDSVDNEINVGEVGNRELKDGGDLLHRRSGASLLMMLIELLRGFSERSARDELPPQTGKKIRWRLALRFLVVEIQARDADIVVTPSL